MKMEEFEKLVEKAISDLPAKFKKRMQNVAVVVEDEPSMEILQKMGLNSKQTLLGLYQGVPLSKRDSNYCNVLPDKITIFKKPIEAINQNKDRLEERIKQVVIHEIGHYFGMNETDLEKIERE